MTLSPAAQTLITWVQAPTTIEEYTSAADAMSEEELMLLVGFEDTTVARLAWLELGQRRGLVSFDVALTPYAGDMVLDVTLDPLRIASTPVLRSSLET